MKRFFPPMTDRPDNGMPFAIFAYWGFAFIMIPLFLPLIGDGFWTDQYTPWLEFGYHTINAIVVAVMLKAYLADSWLEVQLDPGNFIKTVGIALLLMVPLAMYCFRFPWSGDAYPINEMFVAITSGYMVTQQPVFGTACHILFTPITGVGLFYVVGFAPMCCRKTWLGYLMVTFLLMLPSAFDILWRGEAEMVITIFLLRLPMHWIACWSYQKANTVWAPLATLTIFNLAISVIQLILF